MAATLADLADVEGRLGRAFREDEQARVLLLLADASAAIRGFTGRSFTAGAQTLRTRVVDGVVRLPQRTVSAVTAVTTVDGNAVPFQWDGLGAVAVGPSYPSNAGPWPYYPNWETWPYSSAVVDVAYTTTGGVPDDIRGVCAQVVVRALGQRAEDAGKTGESIAGYSYQRGTVGAAGAFGFLPDERAVLERYRPVAAGTVWLT